jgi:hypothetical protein
MSKRFERNKLNLIESTQRTIQILPLLSENKVYMITEDEYKYVGKVLSLTSDGIRIHILAMYCNFNKGADYWVNKRRAIKFKYITTCSLWTPKDAPLTCNYNMTEEYRKIAYRT